MIFKKVGQRYYLFTERRKNCRFFLAKDKIEPKYIRIPKEVWGKRIQIVLEVIENEQVRYV